MQFCDFANNDGWSPCHSWTEYPVKKHVFCVSPSPHNPTNLHDNLVHDPIPWYLLLFYPLSGFFPKWNDGLDDCWWWWWWCVIPRTSLPTSDRKMWSTSIKRKSAADAASGVNCGTLSTLEYQVCIGCEVCPVVTHRYVYLPSCR